MYNMIRKGVGNRWLLPFRTNEEEWRMKKLIVFSVVLALVAGAAFADTYFGAWGRAVFVPFQYNGTSEEAYAGTGVGWANIPNMAIYFAISGEQVGVEVNWDFAASDISDPNVGNGRDGPINAWWKPSDMFKMSLGWARDDRLRGYDTVDSLHFLSGGMWDMNDIVFHRLSTADWWNSKPGALLAFTPIDGLFVGAAINTGVLGSFYQWSYYPYEGTTVIKDIFKRSQYVAGYTIENIGLVRAGYFGSSGGYGGLPQLMQLAFKLTAVEGLTIDLGFGYSIDSDLKDNKRNNMTLGLVAGYKTDVFSVDLNFGAYLGGDKDEGEAGVIRMMLTPAYILDFATIGANFIMGTDFSGEENVLDIGAGLWLAKGFGGGSIKTGVAFHKPAGKDSKINLAIPFELTYSIW